MSTRSELLNQVVSEIERIWGEDGFSGSFEEYEWLLENYGITEEEDNKYIDILEYDSNEFEDDTSSINDLDEEELKEVMDFVTDDDAVCEFLSALLLKYRSNTICAV